MNEQNWRRKEYETWDEAFRGLAPIVRQQSVRIAEFTQTLFTAACSASYGKGTDGDACMRAQYADTAYKCGLYHQLGKALVPPEYQIWQKDFSAQETAVYRKYTTDGRLLVAHLQEKSAREKIKRRGSVNEVPTKNVPWLMVRESCEQHMERYNGSGYPGGRSGRNISPIAHIVGLAKELDRLSAERKSEHPFEDAYEILNSESGTYWDPELIAVLNKCRQKCRAVYEKFIYYTMTIPETIPLLVKHEGRPMGLNYRPITNDQEGTVAGYDAIPWFGGIAGRPDETETADELEEMFKRTDILNDVTFYMLYEASDALLRLQNCKIETAGIVVKMLPSFYKQASQLQRFNTLYDHQPIDRKKLILTVPSKLLEDTTKTLEELLSRYLRNGITLMIDDYHPDRIPEQKLREIGFEHVRLSAESYGRTELSDEIRQMKENGLHVYCADVPDLQTLAWLSVCGAEMFCGPLSGILKNEDEIIRDALSKEEQ